MDDKESGLAAFVAAIRQLNFLKRPEPSRKRGKGYTKAYNKKKKRSPKRVRLARQRGLHPRKPRPRDR